MADNTGSKFVFGDVVIDKDRNIGIVRSVTPFTKNGVTTFYVTYGIHNVWKNTLPQDQLEMYAPVERE